MARQISEIYDGMILEKESNPTLTALNPNAGENATNLLAALTSGSKVAIWRLLFYVVAVALWIHETIFDLHTVEVEAIADTLITGTVRWYQRQAFRFQYGDNLTWNGVSFVYNPINSANQIIKRAAVIELNDPTRLLKVKVAKLDGGGLPIPLSTPENDSFTYFINLIKFAGTNVEVVSQNPDLLKFYADVVYNPLILSATGESLAVAGTFPVEDAINAYIQDLPFNGVLDLDNLTLSVKAVSGVVHFNVTDAQGMETLTAYFAIDRTLGYNAAAGYMEIDPAFPLNTTLTYIPTPQ